MPNAIRSISTRRRRSNRQPKTRITRILQMVLACWTKGPGLAKWRSSPHPWTSLYNHILKHVGNPAMAKRIASQWFHDTMGYWPGERKGANPVGPG